MVNDETIRRDRWRIGGLYAIYLLSTVDVDQAAFQKQRIDQRVKGLERGRQLTSGAAEQEMEQSVLIGGVTG